MVNEAEIKNKALETLKVSESDFDYYEAGVVNSTAKIAVKKNIPVEDLQPYEILEAAKEIIVDTEHILAIYYLAGTVVNRIKIQDEKFLNDLRHTAYKMRSTIDGNTKRACLLYTSLGAIIRGFKSFQK